MRESWKRSSLRRAAISLGICALAIGPTSCDNPSEALDFVLHASVAPDEPPENEELGFLVYVEVGLSTSVSRTDGVLVLTGVEGTVRAPDHAKAEPRQCVTVPASVANVNDLASSILPVIVYPADRSARLMLTLWSGPENAPEEPAAGCPDDLNDRTRLAAISLVVPPDEDAPDASDEGSDSDDTDAAAESDSGGTNTGGGSSTGADTSTSDNTDTDPSSTGGL